MSGMLKKTINANVVANATKYKNDQEKMGKVIGVNEDTNTCTVSVVTRDGIPEVIYNVRLELNFDGVIPWSPKVGDYVRLSEQNKRFLIIGKVKLSAINEAQTTLYDDVFPDNTAGGCGYFGY